MFVEHLVGEDCSKRTDNHDRDPQIERTQVLYDKQKLARADVQVKKFSTYIALSLFLNLGNKFNENTYVS